MTRVFLTQSPGGIWRPGALTWIREQTEIKVLSPGLSCKLNGFPGAVTQGQSLRTFSSEDNITAPAMEGGEEWLMPCWRWVLFLPKRASCLLIVCLRPPLCPRPDSLTFPRDQRCACPLWCQCPHWPLTLPLHLSQRCLAHTGPHYTCYDGLLMWLGLPWWLSGKESAGSAGAADVGSIPGSGRSPGGGHDNPLQYSCLDSPMDREAWQATVYRVTKSQTQLKLLNTLACTDVAKFLKVLIWKLSSDFMAWKSL